MKKDSILVIGGTGFLGINLLNNLSSKNYNLYSLSKSKKNNLRKVKHFKCDLTKKNQAKILSNYEFNYVINFLGNIDHKDKKQNFQVHLAGLKNLYKALNKNYLNLFIQIGSCLEYGKLKSPHIENKKNSQSTYSVYGRAKLLSTKFLIELNKKNNFPSTIMRLYLVYGPNQDINRVIPITIKNAFKDKKFDCSKGLQYRDFIYIDDVVNAILKILKSKKTNGEIINIGSGKPLRIKELIKKICLIVGAGTPVFGKVKMRKDETMFLYPNIQKAKKILNWRPKISLNAGLKKTIQYYKN